MRTAATAAAVTDALTSASLHVRPAGEHVPAHLVGTVAGDVFARLARMNDGDRHAGLRAEVDALVAHLDPARVRATARAVTARAATRIITPDDLDDLLDVVPACTLAAGLGIEVDDRALVDAVRAVVAAFRPGAAPASAAAAEAAVELLVGVIGAGAVDDVTANTIGLLFQAFEATAGLLGAALERLAGGDAPAATADPHAALVTELLATAPPVHTTRRFAVAPCVVGGEHVAAGDTVLVALDGVAGDGLAFGAGAHRCPAGAVAAAIVAGALDALVTHRPDVIARARPTGVRASPATRVPRFGERHDGGSATDAGARRVRPAGGPSAPRTRRR